MMEQLRKQALLRSRFDHAKVDSIEVEGTTKILHAGDKRYEAKAVIIATGARPRLLGIRKRTLWWQGCHHLCDLRWRLLPRHGCDGDRRRIPLVKKPCF